MSDQQWRKLGHIFCADNNSAQMISYARMPFAVQLDGDLYRVFFEARSSENIAKPYYLDIDLNNPQKILNIETSPLLNFGRTGTFDDNGITPFSVVKNGNEWLLYYAGWTLGVKIPFENAIGVARSTDAGRTFEKVFEGPVLGRDKYDPLFATGPLVYRFNDQYHMFYTSFVDWKHEKDGDKPKHFYDIKTRSSRDGFDWSSPPRSVVKFENELEYAFVPRGLQKLPEGDFGLWYCFRAGPSHETYRVGFATSPDLMEWTRRDDLTAGLLPGAQGDFDHDMVCYPHVFAHNNRFYMLYNGDGYGRTGFGLAILEGDV
ncbi:hypothetical protein ABVF61_18090 [Roseibium sp. HPY-6]|uniref:hypothetical protein n=1 Tax=Roseibium sp. HPY-6 TaxID=3229852 RepID=UPI0033903CBA